LKEVYEEAAQLLKWSLSPVTLAKFDVTTSDDTANQYGIKGTPLIRLFRQGIMSRYTGEGVGSSSIIDWVNKKAGPAFFVLNTVDDLTRFQEKHATFALGVFADLESDYALEFKKMSYQYDDKPQIAVTSSAAIKTHLELTTSTHDTIVALKTFESRRNDLPVEGPYDNRALRKWLDRKSLQKIFEYNQTTSKALFSHEVKKHVLVFTDKGADYHEAAMAALLPVAEDYVHRALFLTVDKAETRTFAYFESYFDKDNLPAIVVADMQDFPNRMPKYPLSGNLDADRLHKLIGDVINGTIEQTFKSEPLSPDDTDLTIGPVIDVKGQSFSDLVIKSEQDVFLYLYSDKMCPKCPAVDEIFETMAERYKGQEKLTFARMDGRKNEFEWPNFSQNGPFPKFYFFRGDDKRRPLEYPHLHKWTEELLVKFLVEHSSSPLPRHDEL
jgi:protein disulfide isomerase